MNSATFMTVQYIIGVFLVLYGLLCLLMGVLNKKRSFWTSTSYDGLEKILAPDFIKITNLIMGMISMIMGII
jgi:uncharacterized membrane protein YidH (DUF202 family)